MKSIAPHTLPIVLVAIVGILQHACADETDESFSQDDWAPASSLEANEQDMEKNLRSELEKALGIEQHSAMAGRIAENEEGMRPIFQSLTKNEYAQLGHSSVRYVLHRYFVQKHGWFIEGLFTEGGALNSTSPIHMLKSRVPLHVQGLFEKRLGGRGFDLHELATLVAVVENSVHQEAQQELNNTYKMLGIPLDTKFRRSTAKLLVERYMTGFILRKNMSEVQSEKLWRQIEYLYPTWPMAQSFFTGILVKQTKGLPALQYADVWRVVEEVVDTFGTFHGRQCQGLKKQLKSLERTGSAGCVRLSDFYDKGRKGDSNWLFVESPEYLRHIGALDESNPHNPRVLTSNYINSPNSCLQPSGFYMVCCHNEGDDILGHLEKRLAAPSATPKEILLALPAPVVRSGSGSLRTGSKALVGPSLLHRLEEVAARHEGQIPIHGRLFSQWLHHVYPREVAYPYLSGSKNPEWMEEFEGETGKVSILTDDEMKSFININDALDSAAQVSGTVHHDSGSCAPWQRDEELFEPLPMPHHFSLAELDEDPHLWRAASSLAFLGVVVTMMIHAMRVYRSLLAHWVQPKVLQEV